MGLANRMERALHHGGQADIATRTGEVAVKAPRPADTLTHPRSKANANPLPAALIASGSIEHDFAATSLRGYDTFHILLCINVAADRFHPADLYHAFHQDRVETNLRAVFAGARMTGNLNTDFLGVTD